MAELTRDEKAELRKAAEAATHQHDPSWMTTDPRNVLALLDENARLSEEVRRLKAERQWIPVGERMPEMGERVVVRYFCGRAIAELTSGGFHDADGAIHDVTHWVRLPEPPK